MRGSEDRISPRYQASEWDFQWAPKPDVFFLKHFTYPKYFLHYADSLTKLHRSSLLNKIQAFLVSM